MAPRTKRLEVWLGDLHVADLQQRRWPEIRCLYTDAAHERWPGNSPVLSCSLPLARRSGDAEAFCKGLLPEGHALQQMAADAGVAANDTFALLERYGRDVAGALVIAKQRVDPGSFAAEALDPAALEQLVAGIRKHPLGSGDESELSLPGLQDKLLLVRLEDGRWARPLRGRPSTHILKVDDPRHPGLVEAESLCLRLARSIGLTTVDIGREEIAGEQVLIVSRFDRAAGAGGQMRRVHQEDLCQALGLDPAARRGRGKYESAGGPTLRDLARLLDAFSPEPTEQLDELVRVVAFTVAIGNGDAHGKNLALLHPEPTTVRLAPLYDTVPTLLWPKLRTDAAMAVGGRWSLLEIGRADIVREAAGWPHPEDRADARIRETAGRLLAALDDEVIPADTTVARLVRERAGGLLAS